MIAILGKTSSGKDTILNKLVSKYGYKRVVTYTTRQMRQGEKQNITYHFISEKDFKQKIENGFFAEYKIFNTNIGTLYYGISVEDLKNANKKSIMILSPNSYRDILNKINRKMISIYICSNNETIKKRLTIRGDRSDEAHRRMMCDDIDFKGIENEVDKIIYNNEGDNIDDVVNRIILWLEEMEER